MKLYLDSKDLINILQKATPCTADRLEEKLLRGNHQLAVSFHTICELSVPLLSVVSKTNVMGLLNRLERMPISFIRSDTDSLELKEALEAYSSKREYRMIDSFVDRFDQTVDLHAKPPTGIFLNYSLAETVWDLHSYGALQGLEEYATKMRQHITADRRLDKTPSLKANFAKMIQLNLNLHKLSWSTVVLSEFANWIYENPNRCPGIRLGYEVWHKIVKNKTDTLEDSDMEDYQHLTCLPYIDLMTLDRRMHAYVCQASDGFQLNYRDRLFKSAKDLLSGL